MHRRVVTHEAREALLLGLLLLVAQRLQPALAVARGVLRRRALRGVGHGGQDRAGIADETQGHVPVLADGLVVHVDLDDRRFLAQALAVAHAEVERGPDDQDHVGVVERVPPGEVEMVRVARGQRAASGTVHVRGDVEAADEVLRRVGPACGPHLAAEQHTRTLRVDEDLRQLVDVVRIARALGRRAVLAGLGEDRVLDRDLGIEDVAADLEERGAGSTRQRLTERHRAHVGDPLGRHDVRGELRDRLHDVDVREVLEGPHLVLVERALAADQQHRALSPERVRDSGDGVGRARAGGDDGAAGLAGHAGVSVGGVGRDLLVADVDDLDALVDAAVVDVDDVPAAEREDRVDPLRAESLGDQVATGDGLRLGLGGCCLLYHGARSGHLNAPSLSEMLFVSRSPYAPVPATSFQASVRSTSFARSRACSRTRRSARSASRASSASMM